MSVKTLTLADVLAGDISDWTGECESDYDELGMAYARGRVDSTNAALVELDRYVRHLNDLADRRESEGLAGEAAGLRAAVALLGGGR